MGGNRHIKQHILYFAFISKTQKCTSRCKCKWSIAHGHPLLTLQLHTELTTDFQPCRCATVTQALTQPLSYLYFKLFLAKCNPEEKYQDPNPAISRSSLPHLVFFSSFSIPSKCWDFNYFPSNRISCWGRRSIAAPFCTSEFCQAVMWTILKTLPKCQGKHKKTWFGPVGFWFCK